MPLPVLTVAQMREWERASWADGRSVAEVIQTVGRKIAAFCLQSTLPGDRVLILAGKGNNGEDARAAIPGLTTRNAILLNVNQPGHDLRQLREELSRKPALVVDGLFGIGLSRPLDSDWVALIQCLNQSHARVLSVDVPSGLDADSGKPQDEAVKAWITLTVGAPKRGLLEVAATDWVGRLEVAADVGLAPCSVRSELLWSQPEDFASYPPTRGNQTHKGSFGHLAILAGSLGYHGAAVLAARGAQRARPGLITLHAPDSVYHPIAAQLQAVMVRRIDSGTILPGDWSAYLVGPGLAGIPNSDPVVSFSQQLWQNSAQPVIVDASALAWLPRDTVPRNPQRMITPHPGEAARLLGTSPAHIQANRLGALRQLSRQLGDTWVVLKGHHTLIGRSAGEVYVNPSGNPYLAQGGSGDVLAGFIAGLAAQPLLQTDLLLASRYAVWQHGGAADRLQLRSPNWIVEELVSELGLSHAGSR
jgi:NAD(P)H-hydrate epimerase